MSSTVWSLSSGPRQVDFRPGPVQRVDERGGLRGGGGLPQEEEDLRQDADGRGDHTWRAAGQEARQRQEEEALAVAVAHTSATGEQEEEHKERVCLWTRISAVSGASCS